MHSTRVTLALKSCELCMLASSDGQLCSLFSISAMQISPGKHELFYLMWQALLVEMRSVNAWKGCACMCVSEHHDQQECAPERSTLCTP